MTSNIAIPTNSSETALSTGNWVFKYINIWGLFIFNPWHSIWKKIILALFFCWMRLILFLSLCTSNIFMRRSLNTIKLSSHYFKFIANLLCADALENFHLFMDNVDFINFSFLQHRLFRFFSLLSSFYHFII